MRDPQTIAWHRRMNLYQGDRSFLSAPTFEADGFEQDVAWELDRLQDFLAWSSSISRRRTSACRAGDHPLGSSPAWRPVMACPEPERGGS